MKLTNVEKVFIKALNDKVYNRLDSIMSSHDSVMLRSRMDRHNPMELLLRKTNDSNDKKYNGSILISGNYTLLKDLYTKMYGYIVGDYIYRKYSREEGYSLFMMRVAKPEPLQDIISDENLCYRKFGKITSAVFYLHDGGYFDDTILSLDFNIENPFDKQQIEKIMNVPNRIKGFVSDKNYINVFIQSLQAIYNNYLEKLVMWQIGP